jgi:hypothetical protein
MRTSALTCIRSKAAPSHGFVVLRGLSGARDEFHLAAIVQNPKTLALRILGLCDKQFDAMAS